MEELVCSVDIDAPPSAVWATLVDLAAYRRWNPFIRDARGDMRVGGRVRVRVRPSIPLPVVFHATVLARAEGHEIRWRGHVLVPWLGSGEHTFTVEALGPRRTRFTQREVFGGALPRVLHRLLAFETRRGFGAMNDALKTWVERAEAASARASCVGP